MMNHGFFGMTRQVPFRALEESQVTKETKSTEVQVKFQSNDDFFYIRGIVYIDWVPEGQTVNEVYYKEVLIILRERVRRKRPEMWKKGSWILQHDVPAHNALSCQDVSGKARYSRVATSTLLT
jgi:hypothetical protein